MSGDYSDEDDSSNQKELREESLLGMPRGTTGNQKECVKREKTHPHALLARTSWSSKINESHSN